MCHKSLRIFEVSWPIVGDISSRGVDMAITIAVLLEKGKYHLFYKGFFEESVQLLVLVSVALGAFACGRLSIIEKRSSPVVIENLFARQNNSSISSQKQGIGESEEGRVTPSSPGSVVASKNSDRYHLPWCSGAKTIKEENKIWFASEEKAIAAGYTKAGNCK
jgi:hypothetical protein